MRAIDMQWLATDCARDAVAGSVAGATAAMAWRRVRPVLLQFRRPLPEPAEKTPASPSGAGAITHHHWNLDVALQMLARHAPASKSAGESKGRPARLLPGAEKLKLAWSARESDGGLAPVVDKPKVSRDDLPPLRLETHSAIERAVDRILRVDRRMVTAERRFLERGARIRDVAAAATLPASKAKLASRRASWRRPESTTRPSITLHQAQPSRGQAAHTPTLQPRPVTLTHVVKIDQRLRATTTSQHRYRQVLPVEIVYQQSTQSAPATAPRSGAAAPRGPRLEPLDVKTVSNEVLRRIDKQIRVQRERSGRI